jgi:DNA-binding NtrC family response regulator
MAGLAGLLGESPGIVAVRDNVARLMERSADGRRLPPILIQGETGTGKRAPTRRVVAPPSGSASMSVACRSGSAPPPR